MGVHSSHTGGTIATGPVCPRLGQRPVDRVVAAVIGDSQLAVLAPDWTIPGQEGQ